MERAARFATPAESTTAARFEQLQQERLKRRADIEAWERANGNLPLTPACHDMCPEYERLERELHLDVHAFEARPGRGASAHALLIDHGKAVKKYHRPAAGNETPLPEDIRTPEALQRTLEYLFLEILDNPQLVVSFGEIHSFVRDRTRSIRQDLTLQSCRDARAVAMHEQIARFHILSGHLLCEADPAEFDSFQNTEQLRKVLQSLHEMYEDLRDTAFPNEDEFRAYYVLTHIQDPGVFRTATDFPVRVQHSASVQFALRAAAFFHQNDYVGYCRMVRRGDHLQAALLQSHLTAVRSRALGIMSEAYGQGEVLLSLLQDLLLFVDLAETYAFLSAHGLVVSGEGSVRLTPPQAPAEAVRPRQLSLIEGKRLAMRLSEAVMTRPGGSPAGPGGALQRWKTETSSDIYTALVDFCVPILAGGVVMAGINESRRTLSKHWHVVKQRLVEQLYRRFMDWALHDLCCEWIGSVVAEQRSERRSKDLNRVILGVYDGIVGNVLDDWLGALVEECRVAHFRSLQLKTVFVAAWRSRWRRQVAWQRWWSSHQDRVAEEHVAASRLLATARPAIGHGPTRVIDMDALFSFPQATACLAFDPARSGIRIVAQSVKVVTDLACSPHLVLCLSHQTRQMQRRVSALQVPWTVPCLSVDNVGVQARFDNQIPELLRVSKQQLVSHLQAVVDQCTCAKEYRSRLDLFIQSSVDFMFHRDPAKRLHPQQVEDAVFPSSLQRVKDTLGNLTRGLRHSAQPSPRTKWRPSQHPPPDQSPLSKLQRVVADERQCSAAFDRALAEALKQQQQ